MLAGAALLVGAPDFAGGGGGGATVEAVGLLTGEAAVAGEPAFAGEAPVAGEALVAGDVPGEAALAGDALELVPGMAAPSTWTRSFTA